MSISTKDKTTLRELAKEAAELAADPVNRKKIEKWTNVNDLSLSAEPVFLTHLWEISHFEIFPESELCCESEEARYYEDYLRRKIYFGRFVDDDNVVEPTIPYKVHAWIEEYPELHVEKKWTGNEGHGAHEFVPVLVNDEDIDKLTDPVLHYDCEATERNRQEALEIFSPFLNVIRQPHYFAAKVVDEYSWLRGMENTYMDMAANQDWIHEALQRITDNYIKRFKLMEDAGIWGMADKSEPLGSAGLQYITGMGDWRSAGDSSTYSPKLEDSWGFTCAEVCNVVSGGMHDEYSMKYDRQIMDMFKYWNVGCCETLDRKIELMKAIPNTRKVSISEWCDTDLAAEEIGSSYVYSYRAAGVPFISTPWDIEGARKEIAAVLEAAKRNSCPLEIVLNIGGTFGGDARRKMNEWTEMVRRLILDL